MTLRPLANVFAFRCADPERRQLMTGRIAADRTIAATGSHGDWTWAVADLPGPPSSQTMVVTESRVGLFCESGSLGPEDRMRAVDLGFSRPERLGSVPGDVAFVAFDSESRDAVVVRSCAGLVPWLLFQDGDLIVVSTRMAWFARFLPECPKPDFMARVASADGISVPDRRTGWAGVRSLQSGHAALVGQTGSIREVEYWDPVTLTPHRSVGRKGVLEAAAQLRTALITTLDSELIDDSTNLFALSGGVDSSVLASLAAKPLGRGLMSFNLSSPEDHPSTIANRQFMESINAVAKPIRTWQFRYADDDWVPLAMRAPALGMCLPHPALTELVSMVQDTKVSVYCGGELADDLFAGPFLMWMDWFERLGVLGLARAMAQPSGGIDRRRLARRWLGRRVRRLQGIAPKRMFLDPLPTCFRSEIRDEHAEWLERTARRFQSYERPYPHLSMMRELDGWLLQNWEVCSELGVRRSAPFVSRSVIELACSVHPADHALPPKRLLRLGLVDDVPHKNLFRADKGTDGGESPALSMQIELPQELFSLLSDEHSSQKQTGRVQLNADSAHHLAIVAASLRPVGAGC